MLDADGNQIINEEAVAENDKWNSRSNIWYTPIDWKNYVDQELGIDSVKYTTSFRYLTMLYYGVMNLGSNEFGPVNQQDFVFLVLTLICSALLNALIFGDVATLVSVLESKDSARQDNLDAANSVMDSIFLPIDD